MFIEKHNTWRPYMWNFTAGFPAVRNTKLADKKIKAMLHVVYDNAEIYNWHDGNKKNFKNNLRTIEA